LRLSAESFQRLMVPRDLIRQKLKRHESVQACVFSLVHDAHATATELFEDTVV
jgi:hypothetical protein